MTHQLHRYLAMEAANRRLFAGAWLALSVIDLMLRLIGFERTLLYLMPQAPGAAVRADAEALAQAKDIAGVIAIAGRYTPLNGSCLRQAILLRYLLMRKGLSPKLRIGVAKKTGFYAHAWVELGAHRINQRPNQTDRFSPFERISRSENRWQSPPENIDPI